MPGILGLINLEGYSDDRVSHAASAIDLLGRRAPHWIGMEGARMAVSTIPDPPLSGPFYHEDNDLAACFAGDLHSHEEIPWDEISRCSREGLFDWTQRVDGHYAVAVYLKRERRLVLFADHFGCQPIFYAPYGKGLVFSTHLGAFVRLDAGGGFDREWFHRFLYFGYSPGPATFLENVKRVPPGNILVFDALSGRTKLVAYEERFARLDPPIRGGEAIDKALSAFRRVTAPMFECGRRVQVGLSGGIDGRTVCAFLPRGTENGVFTYGVPGCRDHAEAALAAERLGLRHRQLFFDDAYLRTLPGLLLETIWLSGGLAGPERGMLPAVYRFAAGSGESSPVLSSGMGIGALFRGRRETEGDANTLFETGEAGFEDPAYAELLPEEELPRFRETVAAYAEELTGEHGRLSEPASALSYAVYTLRPCQLAADLEIGAHSGTLRLPALDRSIVELAYTLEHGAASLGASHEPFDAYVLQANLIASHPGLSRVPLYGIPVDVYARHDKLRYRAYRTVAHGLGDLRRRFASAGPGAAEDWDAWSRTVLASQTRSILNRGCIVADYIRPRALETYVNDNRRHWLARLTTAEIVLQLMENGWELSKLSYPGVRRRRAETEFPALSGAV
jgi:asparagine synthetase B (glutamine-hydrolysing)